MSVNTMISASKAHCRIRKQWKYEPSELRGICITFEHDKLWKSLPFGTIRRIGGIETKLEAKKETQAQSDTSRKKESMQKESYTSATF